jgi:hypothetical protein
MLALIPSQIKYAVAGVLVVVAFAAGWMVQGWRLEGKQAQQQVKTVEHTVYVQDKQDAVTAAVGASAASQAAATQVVYRTITKQVDHYVQSPAPTCTLSDDWVRLYNSAATGNLSAPALSIDGASAPAAPNAPAGGNGQNGAGDGHGQYDDVPASEPAA